MKNFISKPIALILIAFAFTATQVEANHFDFLPGDPADFPVQRRIMERGYAFYCFDSVLTKFPGFRAQAVRVVEAAFNAHQINAYEVAPGPSCDVLNTAPADNDYPCGSGTSGCIKYWLDPVVIFYRIALPYNTTNGWQTTQAHEGVGNSGHLMWQHERYHDDGVFLCDPFATYTIMSCATGVWEVQPYDRDRTWNAFVPDKPNNYWLQIEPNGWATARWTAGRMDSGAAHVNNIEGNTNATRVSFAWSDNEFQEPTWVGWGRCPAQYNWCFTDYNLQYRGFDTQHWNHGCLWGRAENAATYSIGQVSKGESPSGYWFLFGCIK